jgi:hypothetical protein
MKGGGGMSFRLPHMLLYHEIEMSGILSCAFLFCLFGKGSRRLRVPCSQTRPPQQPGPRGAAGRAAGGFQVTQPPASLSPVSFYTTTIISCFLLKLFKKNGLQSVCFGGFYFDFTRFGFRMHVNGLLLIALRFPR